MKAYCIGPNGEVVTANDLPDGSRWTAARKALVVVAVHGGLLTLEEALTRWNLTLPEYQSWERKAEKFGVQGLRQTHTQRYRL